MRIALSKPDIGEQEIEYVVRVLRSGQLSLGPKLVEFEQAFAKYVGARYAVAASSGTSALHLCVKALEIGAGDEALTTSFSFVASANCLLYEGALPAFADIHSATLNLDPAQVRDAIARDYQPNQGKLVNRASGRVLKAILPVHVFGVACDMDPLFEIAREFNLSLLEDACEALGATYRGQSVGTFGDAGVFAFYPNKQMTTAEGGMIVTNNPRIAQTCRCLRNQGRDENTTWLRHTRLGYNYRLSELHCALGLAQLERIDGLLAARKQVAATYSRELAGIPEIVAPFDPPDGKRSWFVYVIRLAGPSAPALRDALIHGLRERDIACQAYFPPIHTQPYFRNIDLAPRRPLPNTEAASRSCLALPFFSSMTEEEVVEVCAVVREIVAKSPSFAANAKAQVPEEVQHAS